MKAKYLWLALTTLVFFGCDDNTGSLGMGMLPDSDGIEVKTTSFDVRTESAVFEDGKVFAKTNIGYVGQFTDEEHGFGHYKGSFLTELNCVDSLRFPKPYNATTNKSGSNMAGNLAQAYIGTDLELRYYKYFGDSLSPMQISVYEITKKNLEKDGKQHYTNINPEDYYSKSGLLGKKTFSAVNLEDSSRHQANYLHAITIPMPYDLGKELIEANWADENFDYFKDSETFKKLFKGLYITSEVGDGTVLYIEHMLLKVKFTSHYLDSVGDILKKKDGVTDSTYENSRGFASTMEVIQANNINISNDLIIGKANEGAHTYLKSPAGIYTRAKLPVGDFIDKLDMDNDTINAVKLTFDAYHHDITNEYSMSPPANILLVKEKELNSFFESNSLTDDRTSYCASFSNNQYTFGNITRLITSFLQDMEKAKEKEGAAWTPAREEQWLKDSTAVAIVPVRIGTSGSGNNITITNISHSLEPTYVKLKGGKDGNEDQLLKMKVTYTKFKSKK